jgi:hypothetical protein
MADRKSNIVIILLIALVSLTLLHGVVFSSPLAIIQFSPSVSTVASDEIFSVNITIADVANLTAWQLKLYYKNTVLNCTSFAFGPFLRSGGRTTNSSMINNAYNSTHGLVAAYSSIVGVGAANGSGTLAIVTFRAMYGVSTPLHLSEVVLTDEKFPPQLIPYTAVDGMVYLIGGVNRDVAVINVTSAKRFLGYGYAGNITEAIENQGDLEEDINITTYVNSTVISEVQITLPAHTSIEEVCEWNTLGFTKGNYTVTVILESVPDESDTADNQLSTGFLLLTLPGDLNGDRYVNAKDAVVLGVSFNSKINDAQYNPDADINNDGYVNAKDAVLLGQYFTQHWS